MTRNRTMTALANRSRHRDVWRLALPMMLSNVSIAVLGLVDTAVVGHLDKASYLAGVALASVLFDFLYWGLTFLRMGTSGIAAQEFGAQASANLRASVYDGLLVASVLALGILCLQQPIAEFGFGLLGGSEAALSVAREFFAIKIWGAPAVLATMVMIGWLIGTQNARAAMWLAAIPCVVQALLDVWFVFGLKLGVAGAAYAAVLSAYLGAALGFYFVRRVLSGLHASRSPRWQLQRLRRFISVNVNIMVRTLCLIATFAFFTHQGALAGDVVLAANAVLLNFQMLSALALDGFANALEALVGAAIGRRRAQELDEVIIIATLNALLSACALVAGYALFGQALIALLTDIEVVRETAANYLIWATIAPLASVACFIFDGIFIGATQARVMRNSMIFATFGVFLPAWYLLRELENHGLWLAFLLFFVARGLSMGYYFWRMQATSGFIKPLEA